MRTAARPYSRRIYTYDIETSRVTYNDEPLQSTYLHGLSSMEYRPLIKEKFSDVEDVMLYEAYRTYDEISDRLQELEDECCDCGYNIKIFVHNLSYEFEAMMRNIDFCRRMFNEDRFIAVAPHQPLLATFGHLEFYDSFKILGCRSLATIGDEYGIPKLKDVKGGYNQLYYNWSELPDSEYIYNKRDCDIVLYAICRYMASFTNVSKVSDITVSNTSLIKREVKTNRTIATSQEVHWAKHFAMLEFKNNEDFFGLMQKALAGGYTHANPYYVGKHMTDVYCYDASSMHPSAMWGRKFPYKWSRCETRLFDSLRASNIKWLSGTYRVDIAKMAYNESVKFERPIRNYFIAKTVLYNLKAKRLPNCMYCYISASKCDEVVKGVYDNGKLVSADKAVFIGCDIDYLLIDMLYTYEKIECTNLLVSGKVQFMQKPSREGVRFYARQKSGFKVLEKKLHAGSATIEDFVFEGFKLYDDEVAKHILEVMDEDMAHSSLMTSKGGLNGQFGCNAMKPIRAEVGVEGFGETFKWVDKGESLIGKNTSLNIFTDGIYTVAYSRLHLICFALYLVYECGVIPLYHDTDSIYFTNKGDSVDDAVNKFNDNIVSNSTVGECYNFGIMDEDGYYKDFVTWGSKCYAASYLDYEGNLKVKATVAGASKHELSMLFTEIVKEGGFDYLINEWFHPNISYDETINHKLIRKTPGKRIKGKFIDENGVEGWLDEVSVTVLEDCGYTLRSLRQVMTYDYYSWCYRLRGDKFEFLPEETVSIYNNDFTTYMKNCSDNQYDYYPEGEPSSIFQMLHTLREEHNARKSNKAQI